MIHESGIAFHTPADAPFDWAETGFFNFFAPVSLMRWESDSRIGHGTYMEGLPLNRLRGA